MAERTTQRFIRAEFSHGSRPPTAVPGGTGPVTILSLFLHPRSANTISLLTVRYGLSMLVDNFIHQALLLGLLRRHDELALHVLLDFVYRLAAVIGQKLVHHGTHAQNLFRVDINIGSRPSEPGHPGLGSQNPGV